VFSGPYAWANFTILALGVWAVAQRDSLDAIGMVSGEQATVVWWHSRGLASGPAMARYVFPSPIQSSLLSLFFPIFLFSKASQPPAPRAHVCLH
jgi:hypothetical protein